ncbi:MAG: aromatic ring-hydroxylating dioxygenase subunit alpha [Rhodobacterales bacterium]|nr:aromatic ring-hydroxylating dioxygenase subunit alpha [Rhodobacterales bacterium]
MLHPGSVHPDSPLLNRCPPTLPREAYRDPAWYAAEVEHVWKKSWVYVGRRAEFPAGTIRPIELAGQRLILVHDDAGQIRAFHNTCRHRGAELCASESALRGGRITCPYHQWTYDAQGRLISTAFGTPTSEFRKEEHGLFPVHLQDWRGFLFVCLSDTPPDFTQAPIPELSKLANWPLERLVSAHRREWDMACNWKIFWENFNECLHCPGVHPNLSKRVPAFARGINAPNEAVDWTPDTPPVPSLNDGACTWTVNGKSCGPEFPDLTEAERAEGAGFLTFYPTCYITAHVDFLRVGTLKPLGRERTLLTIDWLVAPETLAASDFDLANLVDFVAEVVDEDAMACEMNQRGLVSDRYRAGTLMPQEFDIAYFHAWLRARLPEGLEMSK